MGNDRASSRVHGARLTPASSPSSQPISCMGDCGCLSSPGALPASLRARSSRASSIGNCSSPALPGGWLADPQYKSMNWERIYDDLRRKQKDPPPNGSGQKQGAGNPGDKPGQGSDQSGGQGRQPGQDWLHGDVLPSPTAQDPAAQAKAEQQAKQRVAAAANMARMAGKLTGELARMVDEFLEAKVPWTDVLRNFMLRSVKSRDSWSRRNRRFRNVYLPTRHSLEMGPIIFIPDTSGSMMGDDMEKICSEISHCAL